MEEDRSIQLCMLCCFSFEANLEETSKFDCVKFNKFCEQINDFQRKHEGRGSNQLDFIYNTDLLEKLSVCSDCMSPVSTVVEMGEKAKEIEVLVNYLQRQLLTELKKLQGYMERFAVELKKVEDAVKNSDENCLAYLVEDLEEEGEQIRSLRDGVVGVGSDLQRYRLGLHQKFNAKSRTRMKSTSSKMKFKNLKRDIKVEPVESLNSCDPAEYVSTSLQDEIMEVEEGPSHSNANSNQELFDEMESDYNYNNDEDSGGDDQSSEGSDFSDEGSSKKRRISEATSTSKSPNIRRKKKKTLSAGRKLTKTEMDELIKPYETEISRMTPLKKGFVVAALRRMKAREALLEERSAQAKGDDDDEDALEDYWYRKKYTINWKPETGEISFGGVNIIINEEEMKLQCSLCSYHHPIPENGLYDKCRNRERLLYQHILGTHLNAYKCLKCDREFKSEWRYRDHLKYHKLSFNVCDICGRPMSSADSLSFHKTTHMSEEEKEEAKRNGTWKEKYVPKPSPTGYFSCEICGRKFRRKAECSKHMQTHDGNRDTVVCPICGKTMLEKSYAIYHMKYACPGREIARVPCPHCDQTFKNSSFLRRHVARIHSVEAQTRAFQCHVCGKGFKSKEDLRMHSALHNDQIQFSCQGCGKGFSVRRYWKRHELTCFRKGAPRRSSSEMGGASNSNSQNQKNSMIMDPMKQEVTDEFNPQSYLVN